MTVLHYAPDTEMSSLVVRMKAGNIGEVILNGTPLTNVMSLRIELDPAEVSVAHLTLWLSDVEIDHDELKVKLSVPIPVPLP